MRDAETTLFIIEDRGKNATSRSMLGNRHGDRQRPSNRSTGEPDTRKRCKSGSEGGGWKRDAAGSPSLLGIRSHEARHKPFPRQPPTLPH